MTTNLYIKINRKDDLHASMPVSICWTVQRQ